MTNIENTETVRATAGTARSWKHRSVIAGIALSVITMAGAGSYVYADDTSAVPAAQTDTQQMGGNMGMMHKAKGGSMQKRLMRALDSVNATDDQKQKINAIFDKAHESVTQLRGQPGAMRNEMKALFAGPTVDANAVEAARQARMQKMDEASKIMSTAMIDAAQVLTPEQRAQLAERFSKKSGAHRPG